jgi:hypothetical protein
MDRWLITDFVAQAWTRNGWSRSSQAAKACPSSPCSAASWQGRASPTSSRTTDATVSHFWVVVVAYVTISGVLCLFFKIFAEKITTLFAQK